MQLDHEQFQGAKELAVIGTQIAAGTAALATLKANEEEYLTERESLLATRLQKALVDSSELIKAIGENHGALVGYRTEVEQFYQKVLSLNEGIMECQSLIEKASEVLEARITKQEQDTSDMRQKNALIKINIDGEREELNTWRERLATTERKINDRSAMLERTLARAKQK